MPDGRIPTRNESQPALTTVIVNGTHDDARIRPCQFAHRPFPSRRLHFNFHIQWIPQDEERGRPEVIDFLEKFRYLAAVLVVLSVPAFGFFAIIPLLFCDSGPLSSCVRWAAYILAIPTFQIVSLVTGWIFLQKRRYPPVSACLMILSTLPALAPIWFLAKKLLR
jgi:hypothetical protein